MTKNNPYEKTPEKIYRIHVSVKPLYFYVDLPCQDRAEAERHAKEMAADPFEGVRLRDYVSYKVEALKPAVAKRRKQSR